MKAVMLSIKPEWCELIANDKKTIEVRKTKPKLDVPFKCYIYCTKESTKDVLWTSGVVGRMADKANGKVIGEFVCDYIENFKDFEYGIDALHRHIKLNACIGYNDIYKYLGLDKCGYGWHISNLKIYDKPKELNEFRTLCKYRNEDGSCQYKKVECDCVKFDFNPDYSVNFAKCCDYMFRPPQSWCYIEKR